MPPSPNYPSMKKAINLQFDTLLKERVDVHIATVDFQTILFGISVGEAFKGLREGYKGAAVAINRADGLLIYEALGKALGVTHA